MREKTAVNTAKRGNYYKHRTKEYLEKHGYKVAYLETYLQLRIKDKKTGEPKTITIKRDVWGSDGMAYNEHCFVFWQSKLGRSNKSKAVRIYEDIKFPFGTYKWVVIWEEGAREPEITVVP